jgi:NAD+ synthase
MSRLTHAVLDFDCAAEAQRIEAGLRAAVRDLGKRGLVVAVSGGIDSSVCAALAVRALGAEHVLCLMLPDRESSTGSLERGRQLVEWLAVSHQIQDITPALEAIGCYEQRHQAVRAVFPECQPDWPYKIAIRGGLDGRYNTFDLVVRESRDPEAPERRHRLGAREFFQLVAATNYKQRIRKAIEYFHADRLNYAVTGTPNRLEYDQGFFVKNGDGAADVKPIAHLYKTQVYRMARYLELPADIRSALPTTDTYSLPQGQDEFYFALPYEQMDYALWARNHEVGAADLAEFLGVPIDRAARILQDIDNKRTATRYLHRAPLLTAPIEEVHGA